MKNLIRPMEIGDKKQIIDMMREFYLSPALITNGSEEIFNVNVDNCIGNAEIEEEALKTEVSTLSGITGDDLDKYVEGYVFCDGDTILGYAMIAKSFSTEFGKHCIWIEDLYIKEQYRKQGIGSSFFKFIEEKYEGYLFRLEVEKGNEKAINTYKKADFTELPYLEMKK